MKGVVNLTHSILSICLLIGSLVHVDLFSIIYTLLFLTIPWAVVCSTVIRLRFFYILSLIALITSSVFLLFISSLHIFTITAKGKDAFSIQCSLNVRILQHFGFIRWTQTTNKILFIITLIMNVMIACKKTYFSLRFH